MKENFIKIAVAIVAVIFTSLMIYSIWQESSNPKIELDKAEWQCVKTEPKVRNIIIGGKLMPYTKQECTEYERQ